MGRDGSGTEVPDSIRTMLAARLDRLPAASAKVVASPRWPDGSSTLPVLVAATELDADEVLDAADLAVAAGLLREDGAGRLVTPHALIRHAVLAGSAGAPPGPPPARRRRPAARVRVGGVGGRARPPPPRRREPRAARRAPRRRPRRRRGGAAARGLRGGTRLGRARLAPLVAGDDSADLAALEVLDSLARRLLGDRVGAEAAARHAVRIAGSCGDPMLRARAAEAWVLSISGIGFEFGEAADPELVAVLDDAVAALPADAVEHQVWLRSMLVSVLVETGAVRAPGAAQRGGAGDRRAHERPRVDGVRAVRPPPRAVAPGPPRRAPAHRVRGRRPRPPGRRRAPRADGDARRDGRPHGERSGRRAAGDARRVRAPGRHPAHAAVRHVHGLPALVPARRHRRLRGRRTARRRGAGRRPVVARHEHRDGPRRPDVLPRLGPRPARRDRRLRRGDGGGEPGRPDLARRPGRVARRGRPRRRGAGTCSTSS